ncbi:unnamed protein product [Rotaria sp. Silwood1]|nr:unnamed protein product [Rotaria sp. Silwood1]CAF3425366.1 unnamed protein product [Rotaria sp. Silwood1]CAF3449380.1 unnamed protein product [Rotaria sp. Silwood1]CAF3470081.1 unnamed protein product [Rotaria sp. Silwood1]CAF4520512.1 unnamed protein product [Rotaria sp. Silwood1]
MATKYTDASDPTSVPHQRFTDVKYETNEFLLPIDDCQKVDLLPIECSNGKVIKNHSYFAKEDEVLLLPGIELLVTGKVCPAWGLSIIELREITDSSIVLLKPPFLESSTQPTKADSTISADFNKKLTLTTTSPSSSTAILQSKELLEEVKTLLQELKFHNEKFNDGWLELNIANLSLDDGKAIAEGLKMNKNVDKFLISSNNNSMECLKYMVD